MTASHVSSGNVTPIGRSFTPDQIKTFLLIPFRAGELGWRIVSKSRDRKSAQVAPYVNVGEYHKRLTELVGTDGWDEMLVTNLITSIQREKYIRGQNVLITTGKVIITSTITIQGLGTKSNIGEGWADDDNGSTRASAQATKRTCVMFGLGAYLLEIGKVKTFQAPLLNGDLKESNWPHYSELPDFAIHPEDMEEARQYRADRATQRSSSSRSSSDRALPQVIENSNTRTSGATGGAILTPAATLPAASQPGHSSVVSTSQSPIVATAGKPTLVTKGPVSGSTAATAAQVPSHSGNQLPAAFLAPDMIRRLTQYKEQLSVELITSVVTGITAAYKAGKMKGDSGDQVKDIEIDVFYNLDLAVNLVNDIEEMEPLLPSENTLTEILLPYKAESLFDLKSLGDLKVVNNEVLAIYKAEQVQQSGLAA